MLRKRNIILLTIIFLVSLVQPAFAAEKSFKELDKSVNFSGNSIVTQKVELEKIQNKNNTKSSFEDNIVLGTDKSSSKNFAANSIDVLSASNTSPNTAELITQFGGISQGTINAQAEQRWYRISTAEKLKLSLRLLTDTTGDFDLYMYKLDETTMTLKFLDSSRTTGGTSEYLTDIQDKGIYYFMVYGAAGNGNYILSAFGSVQDMDQEINDTLDTASIVNMTTTASSIQISGVIDNPNDRDWHKVTLNSKKVLQVDYTVPKGANYNLYYSDGKDIFNFNRDNSLVLEAGTYYFIMLSSDGTYNSLTPYNFNAKIIFDANMTLLKFTDDLKTFFTKDNHGVYYVNGNPISFKYKFENHVSNSAGNINTYMNLYPGTNYKISGGDWYGFIDYTTNFFGAQSRDRVLIVTIFDIHSAVVNRNASGAYDDSAHYSYPYARVIIDSDTGEVVDMLEPNYYYQHGSQTFKIEQNYTNK